MDLDKEADDMKRREFWTPLVLIPFTLFVAYIGDLPRGGSDHPTSPSGEGPRDADGTISQTPDTMLTIETEDGTVRRFALESANIGGITGLQPGESVLLRLEEEKLLASMTLVNEQIN